MLELRSTHRLAGLVPQFGGCWNAVELFVLIPFQNILAKKHICRGAGSRFYPSHLGGRSPSEDLLWVHA